MDTQREAIERNAAEYDDWELIEIYEDAISGADMEKRRDLLRLLKDATLGKYEMMISYDLDRFGRDVRDIANNQQS